MFVNFKTNAKQIQRHYSVINEIQIRHPFVSPLSGWRLAHNWSTNWCPINRHFCDHKVAKSDTNVTKLRPERNGMKEITDYHKLPQRHPWVELVMKKPNELISWYESTPRERRKVMYLSALLVYAIKPLGVLALLCVVYMYANGEDNPLTGRPTVYNIPEEMLAEIETDVFKEIFIENLNSGRFVPSTDPSVKRLDRCVDRLIGANDDLDVIGDGKWTPVVIDNHHMLDVIVLKESQNIFISRKLLDLCETDDELAYLLAHQLSHSMLDHSREPTTYIPMLYRPLMAIVPKFWLINQDKPLRLEIFESINAFLDKMAKQLVRKCVYLNAYSEELEEEADRIAMQLLTRACYDVRKCGHFCNKYKHFSEPNVHTSYHHNKSNKSNKNDNFFIKHPITDNKLLYLFQYIKPFIELRKQCKCEPLVE